jgi:hypothetical protein
MEKIIWKNTRLNSKEEKQALLDAKIPLDPSTWTNEQLATAATFLDKAQSNKIYKITGFKS